MNEHWMDSRGQKSAVEGYRGLQVDMFLSWPEAVTFPSLLPDGTGGTRTAFCDGLLLSLGATNPKPGARTHVHGEGSSLEAALLSLSMSQ